MRQDGALWAPSPTSGAAQEDALRLLDESYGLLQAIFLAVGMQLRSLELERCRLLGGQVRGVEQLQLGASLLSVIALAGFDRQAGEIGEPCDRTLSSASFTIGLIRLMKLLAPEGGETEEITGLAEPLE